MKVAVITLQLHTNYGGVLQAFALQRVLESLGNDVEIIQLDEITPEPEGLNALRKLLTRSFRKYVLAHRDVEIFRERRVNREFPSVGAEFLDFFHKYLNIRYISSFREIGVSDYDAFIVGSDQVWRPEYNPNLMHSFLDFTWKDSGRPGHLSSSGKEPAGWEVRRIAYAVSFGCDSWEYTARQTAHAAILAGRFDALSFRENSGADNAVGRLGVAAVTVLDPTMLLGAEEYTGLIESRKDSQEAFEYILDRTAETEDAVAKLEARLAMPVRRFLAADPRGREDISLRVQPSVESWIAGIAGAGFVLTDSFHACIFSILFHRPFAVVVNRSRGVSRIEWLLGQFGLEDRLVTGASLPEGSIDWEGVDSRLGQLRAESVEFLKKSLRQDI